jgi:hypothetical protein
VLSSTIELFSCSVLRLNCGIVVFDTTAAASLDSAINEYAPYLHTQAVQAQFVLCVGTKRDLEAQRQVPTIEVLLAKRVFRASSFT